MIDKTKQYKTRDGREVRIYATDGAERWPVQGAVNDHRGWVPIEWMEDGRLRSGGESPMDLVEVKPRHKETVKVHLLLSGRGAIMPHIERPQEPVLGWTILATQEVTFDVEVP